MIEFTRNGNKIFTRPTGIDYELEKNRVYNLKYDYFMESAYLEMDGVLSIEKNVYKTQDDEFFFNRILNYFNKTNKKNTGVMLKGIKGGGKTLTIKQLAIASNLPIIVVDTSFPARKLVDFFIKFKQETCVIFDEIDKNEKYWPTEQLISFLDGVQGTNKKLVLFTCNNDNLITEFVKDRCSRIRYYKECSSVTEGMIEEIVSHELPELKDKDTLMSFIIDNFKVLSYDNILSFIEEIKEYPNLNYNEIVKDLNINLK